MIRIGEEGPEIEKREFTLKEEKNATSSILKSTLKPSKAIISNQKSIISTISSSKGRNGLLAQLMKDKSQVFAQPIVSLNETEISSVLPEPKVHQPIKKLFKTGIGFAS